MREGQGKGGGFTRLMHSRNIKAIDPRIPAMLGRTSRVATDQADITFT